MKKQLLLSLFCLLTLFNSCKKEEIPPIIADFDYTETTNGTVNFFNTSQNADTYEWDFNTGDNSASKNPTYTFANNKDYLVTLTARGKAGQNSKSKTIRITTKPTTGSLVFWTNFNSNNIKVYVSGTYRGLMTKYVNGSTPPSCNLEGFVTVTLPQGAYTFSADEDKLIGALKWSGTINVTNGQCKSLQLTK